MINHRGFIKYDFIDFKSLLISLELHTGYKKSLKLSMLMLYYTCIIFLSIDNAFQNNEYPL